ncbi:MAG: hypothetical protein D4R90_01780 [Nitrosopumilales archaeon]|nr:MAG: hypothetical protein D4R90_01780 [Nitrosopumilales archaeon]
MKRLFLILLLLPFSLCYAEPTTPGTILTFYITDINLSTDHRAVMIIPTSGLVDFTINGVPVSGPNAMVETGIDTGTFQVQLTLPDSVNGQPLKDGDVVLMTYHQQADYSGHPTTLTQSKVLTSAPSGPVSGSSSHVRIGNYFKLRIYAPDYNLDSFRPDDIPLDMIEFHMGGVQTTLGDSAFQTNPYTLRETGPDTNMFEVTVKMPTSVNGYPVEMGSTLEFRFNDHVFPSSVFLTVGSMGGIAQQSTTSHRIAPLLTMHATNSQGAIVNYANSAILYGYKAPICDPQSGSFFGMGKTTVTCAAKDQNGNSIIKTFVVNVVPGQSQIHSWTKKLVGYWCGGDIDDTQLYSTMKYLTLTGAIIILGDSENLGQTPDKTMLCQWASGQVSDQDVAKSLYLLSR